MEGRPQKQLKYGFSIREILNIWDMRVEKAPQVWNNETACETYILSFQEHA